VTLPLGSPANVRNSEPPIVSVFETTRSCVCSVPVVRVESASGKNANETAANVIAMPATIVTIRDDAIDGQRDEFGTSRFMNDLAKPGST
jgi:predicted fused transcriptional regulator/phosphomethylpyrimidine kinase